MVEALRVAMMTQPAHEALDPTYNGCILHLIEDYSHLQVTLSGMKQQLIQAREDLQRENHDVANLTADWAVQEARYKAEVKRLELIIHRQSGNSLEAVMMARSGSLLRGRGQRLPDSTDQSRRNVPASTGE